MKLEPVASGDPPVAAAASGGGAGAKPDCDGPVQGRCAFADVRDDDGKFFAASLYLPGCRRSGGALGRAFWPWLGAGLSGGGHSDGADLWHRRR